MTTSYVSMTDLFCGAAMAFPATYEVRGTGRQRVKQFGNAVTPPVAQLLLERCLASLQ